MKKKRTLIVAGVVVITAALAGLVLPNVLGSKDESVAEILPAVTLENPRIRSIELSEELIGTIEPDSMVYVTPLGSGEVTSVSVKTGDMVGSGQILCVIDTKQVELSRIAVETAKVNFEDARKQLERYSVLYASGDVAEADYQSLRDQVDIAKLQYENAKIEYDTQLKASEITAPITGRVESFDVSVHDMVSPQTTLGVISGEGEMAVTFYVTERIVSTLKPGDTITVEKNGTSHSAAITEVSTIVDKESGLFKAKASIPTGENLATGTSVKLYVTSQKAENVLTVPVDSVQYEGGSPFIYTYIDGILKQNPVTLGLKDEVYVEVHGEITEADQVVTSWTREMFDGSKAVTLSSLQ
jgi:RND family efflux transporter MFP subunit